ncbi:MAG: metal-dependent hydrolase [Desulfovibrio sp.]|nr:metal-dependent hydrolase [Desulfovibrio sp.]
MKWITHQTGAVLGALALAMPQAAVASAVFGAVFPDVIDQRWSAAFGKRRRQKVFNRIHRGASHWFGWWLLLFAGSLCLELPQLAQELALGFGFGALTHTGLDLLTPAGVPLTPFSRRGKLKLPICATGHIGEYALLFAMICAAICYWHDLIIAVIERLA